MNQEESEKSLPTMAGPGRYQIRVRGRIEPGDARRLRGLSIENTQESGVPVACLSGELPDQAALLGVLDALNTYQLPVLSVEYEPVERPKRGQAVEGETNVSET